MSRFTNDEIQKVILREWNENKEIIRESAKEYNNKMRFSEHPFMVGSNVVTAVYDNESDKFTSIKYLKEDEPYPTSKTIELNE